MTFERGISPAFTEALADSLHWAKIRESKDVFFAMRGESINVYSQGCSIFKISYSKHSLIFETHYKYLIHPRMKNPYIKWEEAGHAIRGRLNEIFIDKIDIGLLKSASSRYAGAEKIGIHDILKANKNIIDVEIALTREAEKEQDNEDENEKHHYVADRIDFAALQRINGKITLVFFEAKRYDNPELRTRNSAEAPVIGQVRKYQESIEKYTDQIRSSYLRVCQNLCELFPDRCDDMVKEIATQPVDLVVDSRVKLVVFGFDNDQKHGDNWDTHRKNLKEALGETRVLLKGDPKGFTNGISKYKESGPA